MAISFSISMGRKGLRTIDMNRTLVTILTWNKVKKLKKTIDSFLKYNKKESFDILVLDNGSTDSTEKYLKKKGVNYIKNKSNQGIYLGCVKLWDYAFHHNYKFILHLENDFSSIGQTFLKELEDYLDENKEIGFVRLNDKKDLNINYITKDKIIYYDCKYVGGHKICKFNYHFCFNPYLFRAEYSKIFSKQPYEFDRFENNETMAQQRYQDFIGLHGARIMSDCPFKTLKVDHSAKGWKS